MEVWRLQWEGRGQDLGKKGKPRYVGQGTCSLAGFTPAFVIYAQTLLYKGFEVIHTPPSDSGSENKFPVNNKSKCLYHACPAPDIILNTFHKHTSSQHLYDTMTIVTSGL